MRHPVSLYVPCSPFCSGGTQTENRQIDVIDTNRTVKCRSLVAKLNSQYLNTLAMYRCINQYLLAKVDFQTGMQSNKL